MRTFGVSKRVGHNSDGFYNRKMFKNGKARCEKHFVEKNCPESLLNTIHHASSKSMEAIPDDCVHLMVTSPPYNVGKDYDEDLTVNEYLDLINSVWKDTYRVLAYGGRACINVANIGRKPYLPLNSMIIEQMLSIGFLMRGEIIWNKGPSAGVSCAWGSWLSASNPVLRDTHEYILIFSKGDYSRQKKYKDSTINKDEFLSFTKSVWSFPAESAKRVNHPAPFPIELPERLIKLYTFCDDVVLDPFMGSGSTALAAIKNNRYYIGYDNNADYVKITEDRIKRANRNMSLIA